uniref:Uncharacterized protein n=1 Tax=Triticum urartu TaxID=4572 RepID=A0A8R7UJR4_TRIUA
MELDDALLVALGHLVHDAAEPVEGAFLPRHPVEVGAPRPERRRRHHQPRPPLRALDEPPVVGRLDVAEEGLHGLVLLLGGVQQPREVARQMGDDVHPGADGDPRGDHLVEVEVVVERHDPPGGGAVAEPRDGVAAHGEEHERHVELERLGAALGDAHAVAHHLEHGAPPVLHELPGEEAGADGEPQDDHPATAPVVLQEVAGAAVPPAERVGLRRRLEVLAQ